MNEYRKCDLSDHHRAMRPDTGGLGCLLGHQNISRAKGHECGCIVGTQLVGSIILPVIVIVPLSWTPPDPILSAQYSQPPLSPELVLYGSPLLVYQLLSSCKRGKLKGC